MFGFSVGEIFLLAIIALIVIGPKQLPEFARQMGRLINDLKRSTSGFAEELKQQARVDFNDIGRTPEKDKPAESSGHGPEATPLAADEPEDSNKPKDPHS